MKYDSAGGRGLNEPRAGVTCPIQPVNYSLSHTGHPGWLGALAATGGAECEQHMAAAACVCLAAMP